MLASRYSTSLIASQERLVRSFSAIVRRLELTDLDNRFQSIRFPLRLFQIHDSVNVYLLGTAHVSTQAVADTELLLRLVQPNALFLELCPGRWRKLRNDVQAKEQFIRDAQEANKLLKDSDGLLKSISQGFQYSASSAGSYGGEMQATIQYWNEQNHEPLLCLGDLPQRLIIKRAGGLFGFISMGLTELKLLFGWDQELMDKLSDATKAQIDRGFFAWKLAIAEGDEAAIGAANEVMRKSGRASMIIDRDVWMAAKLVQVCAHISETLKQASVDEQCSMVALVGAGHVSGMTELLTKMNGQSCEQQMMDLLTSDEYVELLDDSEREHLVNTLFYVPEPVQ